MKVSARDQVAGIVQRNGGRPDALLSVMRQQVAHSSREMGRSGPSVRRQTGRPAMPPGGRIGSSMQGTMERPAAPPWGGMGSSMPPQGAVEDAVPQR
jgi:hypothetical protein